MTHAQGGGRLDIVDLTQLQRLPAQQSAQPRPAGHAQDQHEEQQAQIGALHQAREVVGVVAHVDLQQEDGRGDQEHARDGVQRGVEILDDIVDPASEIAGHDAEQDRGGQHHQGGQRANQQTGADALERLIKDILADLVRPEDVVLESQLPGNRAQHQHDAEHREGGPPGGRRASRQDGRAGRRRGLPARAGDQPKDAGRQHDPDDQALQRTPGGAPSDVEAALTRGVLQMRATVFEPRKITHQGPVRLLDRLLHEEMGGERRRIGLLLSLAQPAQRQVEQTQDLGRIAGLGAVVALPVQRKPKMHRIEEPDDDVETQHDDGRHAHA